MYCPKNIDIPAYEGYLKSCIASERERYAIAIARAEAHKAGYEEGISVALEGLRCSNYEKKLDDESYRQVSMIFSMSWARSWASAVPAFGRKISAWMKRPP